MNNKHLSIGQLGKLVGLRPSALRYYEEAGLIHPTGRTDSGYRYYSEDIIHEIRFIQRAQHLGFTLNEIKTLIKHWKDRHLGEDEIIRIAEERYLQLEKEITHSLVLQRELGLLLQDIHKFYTEKQQLPSDILLEKLLNRVCSDPLNKPTEELFEWLLERTGCNLSTDEGKQLLQKLKGKHIHIWQEEEGYTILVTNQDTETRDTLIALTSLERQCHIHKPEDISPELSPNEEGYLIHVTGENAFIFARLFLTLDKTPQKT